MFDETARTEGDRMANPDYDLEYVGFWPRVGAAILDALLEGLITIPLLVLYYGKTYWNNTSMCQGPVYFLLSYIFPMFITITFWLWKQATPGKMAIQSKIVDARTGKRLSVAQCFIRYVAYFLSILPLGLGLFWVIFDSRKQGWHDKLARTVVVRPKNRVAAVKFEG